MPAADTIAGQVVAGAIADVRRLLELESAWTPDSDGVDALGRPLTTADEISTLAARRSLLGAVEAVTSRLELQVAVTAALRDAIAAAGWRHARDSGGGLAPLFFASIHHFNRASTHREVLAVLDDARNLAATSRWSTGWGCSRALPDRTLTTAEHDDICIELQGIWMFFESVAYAAQYSSTVSMVDAVIRRQDALMQTLKQHAPPPPMSERCRRAAGRLRRRRWWPPAPRTVDDIPF